MTSLEDMRALWKIPLSRKTITSAATTEDDQPSTSLAGSVGITNPEVIDMSPERFWELYFRHFEDRSIPPESVVAILGDLLRDKSHEQSLPWYESLLYFVNSSAYFASLIREFPFVTRGNVVVTVTLRNELGNSLPIQLRRSNCQQFFTSIVRETGDDIRDIRSSSWKGYVLYLWDKSDHRIFFRGKFSARITVSDGNISRTIHCIVCSHDLTSLQTEQANFAAYQSFTSIEGISLDNAKLI